MTDKVLRGDVWLYDPEPSFGKEMKRNPNSPYRTCVVVSDDKFNTGPSDLVIIVPCTTKDKGSPSQVIISKTDGGVKQNCYARPEHIHSIDKKRFYKKWGSIQNPDVMKEISEWLADLLNLNFYGFS